MREVTQIPLQTLWDKEGEFGHRLKWLSRDKVTALLKLKPIVFFEADLGKLLREIPTQESYAFWKSAKKNVPQSDIFFLDDYPDRFILSASEWEGRNGQVIVLLEKFH